MATVLPQEVPVNQLQIKQSISPTDYLLINSTTLALVPWSSVVISKEQTDFYTSIESISSTLVNVQTDVATLSTTIQDSITSWNSTYTTVNDLSAGWVNVVTSSLSILSFISLSSINYTGSNTPLNNPIVVGFNGAYGQNIKTDINNPSNNVNTFTDNASIQFQPGTYRVNGTLYSSCGNLSSTAQYILAFYNNVPSVNNNKTYSANNTPIAQIYSTLGVNAYQSSHIFDTYLYVDSACYALLLYVSNDAVTSVKTGVGVNSTLNIFGGTPSFGGTLNITFTGETNFLNFTLPNNSSIVVRPAL